MLKSILITAITCVIMVVFLSFNAVRAGAATRLTDDLNDLIQMAEAAVEGQITDQSAGPESGSIPTTLYTLRVAKTLKGSPEEGSNITLESLGGSNSQGKEGKVVCFGEAKFKPGDQVVVLIRKRGLNWRVLGGDVGVIILDGPGNAAQASRANGTFEFYVADKSSLTGYHNVNTRIMSHDLLSRLIRTVVTTKRPVLEELPEPAPAIHAEPSRVVMSAASDSAWPWKGGLSTGIMGLCLLLVVWGVSKLARARSVL